MDVKSYFKGDTLIETKDGLYEIKNIKKGDFIVSPLGKLVKVKKVVKQNYNKVYKLKSSGFDEVIVNEDALIITKDKIFNTVTNTETKISIKEILNANPTNIYVGLPINQEKSESNYAGIKSNDPYIWNLLGRYIIDYKNCIDSIELGGSFKSLEVVSDHFKLPLFVPKEGCYTKVSRSSDLFKFLTHFKNGISPSIKSLPIEYVKEFLNGMIDTLNAKGKNNTVQINSDDKQFIYSISRLVHKVYKVNCEIHRSLNEEGEEYFFLLFNTNKNFHNTIIAQNFMWYNLSSIQEVECTDNMYSLELEETSNIIANNCIFCLS